jgi:hypothetical protein
MPDARITVPTAVPRGKAFEVRIIVRHPMETGYRTDESGKSIPRNVIRTLVCRYDNDVVRRGSRRGSPPIPICLLSPRRRPAPSRSNGSTQRAQGTASAPATVV